ncbi:MAG: choice-of-anchor D domain-containing protein, partial [Verrucomicrobiota bacterium]
GSVNVGSNTPLTFTIKNTGSADLTGLTITKDGTHAADFTITSSPAAPVAGPSGTTTFIVSFAPGAAGARTAAIHIANNDSNENPFDINLTGTGTVPPAPEIAVEQPAGTDIPDAGAKDFGSVSVGSNASLTFTIKNIGNANLTDLSITKDGANAGDFTVTSSPTAPVTGPSGTTSFVVRFAPSAEGARSAAIHIANNDSNENPFDINLTGTGTAAVTDPFAICLVGQLFEPRVGNQITLDLNRLTSPGQTIRVLGRLPSGLIFNRVTGLISGTITGRSGSYQVRVQILQGRTVVRTITLPITVLPFPSSLIGDYDSLLENAEGVPTGALRISITSANRWTATLETEGASKRTTTGDFTLAQGLPVAPITTVFPAAAGAQSVTISLSIDATSPNITATYNGGTLRGFRLATAAESSSMTVPYNLVFDAGVQDGINIPAGLGWMKGKVSRPETGTFSGLLGDGTPASLTLRLSPAGQAVLWTQPYTNKKSFVGGIVTLGNLGQPVSTNPKLTDTLWWSKAADDRTLSYPDGFPAMPITLGTSRWTIANNASALAASLGWGEDRKTSVTIDGAGLSNKSPQSTEPKLPTEFTLDDAFSLIASRDHNNDHDDDNSSNKLRDIWKGKVVKNDGTFTGVLTIPEGFSRNIPSGTADVSGVIVQDDAWGVVTGCGLIKVPTNGEHGRFRTAAIILEQ